MLCRGIHLNLQPVAIVLFLCRLNEILSCCHALRLDISNATSPPPNQEGTSAGLFSSAPRTTTKSSVRTIFRTETCGGRKLCRSPEMPHPQPIPQTAVNLL